ncbi:MAG TPA: arginine--tRNA ligase [Acidimicrobiales bacterium]|nr:arginine--tRNA ligase [Acidimicrobiales bacterium]
MDIANQLAEAVGAALQDLGVSPPAGVVVEPATRPEHGDWYSNAALVAARSAGIPPRELAHRLAERLTARPPAHLREAQVAGPGFLNFFLHNSWLHEGLAEIVEAGEGGFARPDLGRGERVQLEFVSANPTGPLHVGNGWLASYGDSLARIMRRCGWSVWREYYVNDTGGQILRLGQSLLALKRGEPVPEEGYKGDYVRELAMEYEGPWDETAAGRWAAGRVLSHIGSTLQRIGVEFDEWFSQASIEEGGAVEETIKLLEDKGLIYRSEGAVWLRTTAYGDSRDRVLVKSDGTYTYLAGDLAYHRDKFLGRGFDRVIDVFGADHHGQVASLKAAVAALGVEPDRLEVRLGQMVSLAEGRMSKRAGNFVSLDSLIDDIGPDAVRLLSLMNSIDQATTLDLELVRSQSMENPVFYVQYAHARIASIERFRQEKRVDRLPLDQVDLGLLAHERELELLRCLVAMPEALERACLDRAPHKLTGWVRRLAGCFHGFYHDCYVLGESVPPELTQARLWLVEGTRIALAVALELLGVQAPEAM